MKATTVVTTVLSCWVTLSLSISVLAQDPAEQAGGLRHRIIEGSHETAQRLLSKGKGGKGKGGKGKGYDDDEYYSGKGGKGKGYDDDDYESGKGGKGSKGGKGKGGNIVV